MSQYEELYEWVDSMKLSRPKKSFARDFSDGVLVAEIVHAHNPQLAQLHWLSPTSNAARKAENWDALNHKVLRKLGIPLARSELLLALRDKLAGYDAAVRAEAARAAVRASTPGRCSTSRSCGAASADVERSARIKRTAMAAVANLLEARQSWQHQPTPLHTGGSGGSPHGCAVVTRGGCDNDGDAHACSRGSPATAGAAVADADVQQCSAAGNGGSAQWHSARRAMRPAHASDGMPREPVSYATQSGGSASGAQGVDTPRTSAAAPAWEARAAAPAAAAAPRTLAHAQALLAERDAALEELREEVEALDAQVWALQGALRVKDSRIRALSEALAAATSAGAAPPGATAALDAA